MYINIGGGRGMFIPPRMTDSCFHIQTHLPFVCYTCGSTAPQDFIIITDARSRHSLTNITSDSLWFHLSFSLTLSFFFLHLSLYNNKFCCTFYFGFFIITFIYITCDTRSIFFAFINIHSTLFFVHNLAQNVSTSLHGQFLRIFSKQIFTIYW